MNKIRERVREFLRKNEMYYGDIDIDEYCSIFLDEMKGGLEGGTSSLAMIPTYIEVDREIPENKPVIVLDAGGTNFRVATVYFDGERRPVIGNFRMYTMPGLKGEVSKKDFFKTIAGYMTHVRDESSSIGFCFSYPTEMLPNKDGRAVQFSKEIQAKEVEGELIGDNLISAIRSTGYRKDKKIVLLNDTVATLLAGKSAFRNRVFGSFIGFILGTGTNCCYIESNKNIKKEGDLNPLKNQIVNVESGGFAKGPRGGIDLEFDQSTVNPGAYTFEKMISGAYFGALCCKVIQKAAEDGLFSESLCKDLKNVSGLNTKDITAFMDYPYSKSNPLASVLIHGNEEDPVTLYYVIDHLIERAAKLTAFALSSVVIKSEKGLNPWHPVCITAEGSVFYGLRSLKTKVECYLKNYLNDRRERYFEFTNVENATLIGAAIAGLTN